MFDQLSSRSLKIPALKKALLIDVKVIQDYAACQGPSLT